MSELSDSFSAILDGAIKAVEDSEQRHLTAQVAAVKAADGKAPGIDEVLKAFANGWSPDYFVGAELQISAQMTVSTGEERTIGGGASASIGPISVQGTVTDTFRKAEETNLSVNCVLKRQSRSSGLTYAVQQLGLQQGAAANLPTGTAAPPAALPKP